MTVEMAKRAAKRPTTTTIIEHFGLWSSKSRRPRAYTQTAKTTNIHNFCAIDSIISTKIDSGRSARGKEQTLYLHHSCVYKWRILVGVSVCPCMCTMTPVGSTVRVCESVSAPDRNDLESKKKCTGIACERIPIRKTLGAYVAHWLESLEWKIRAQRPRYTHTHSRADLRRLHANRATNMREKRVITTNEAKRRPNPHIHSLGSYFYTGRPHS